jgi:molybdenum cofactor cytidylyltransferase
MSLVDNDFVAGLVLAAGGSSRLGRPKQTLPFNGTTLLGHVLDSARACGFEQLVVTLGGASDEVRGRVDLSGATVVDNPSYEEGCSSSIAAALPALDSRCDVLVLMLGDQPGVGPTIVRTLLARHGELADLHGDKAVWKLLERRADDVREVQMPGRVPPDVDTWADYEALVGAEAARSGV